ncbi:putative fad- protein [Botrytis fragariae]|uniref:Putative fad- protein n=1 Tax=Botrytis fragariae TaxID=1964551 RepID=A0A8H6EH89_9HELO|nr:putative fad- protein [Botrytis fragariae]KAF5871815.1 putative fad- protein [Botrytis fragariae]
MRQDPRSSNETASVISLKYNNDENLATLLSNTTTEKRSIPELTPLTCWTAKLLFRADAEYPSVKESLIEVNWSEACRLPAQCTISPTSAEEVSLAMKVIPFLQVPFAVRSGGHSSNPYWSSIGFNGILISTTNLDSIAISSDSSIASIGPGLRRGAVYEALDPYGVSVIGGRTPRLGRWVVLATGEIVNANAETNSGLFWALKVGGPNFGCSMGLVYSEPAIYPDAFTPFAAIPNGIVRVPAANATVSLLSTILGRWTTITNWASVDDDNAVLDAVKSIGDQFETLGAARDTNLSYLYMNDCYADQNPLAQYPPASIKAMKEIAAKYDLIWVFQLLQKGFGFGGKF